MGGLAKSDYLYQSIKERLEVLDLTVSRLHSHVSVSFEWFVPKLLISPNLPGIRPRHMEPYPITLTIESRLEWRSTLLEFLAMCPINLETKNTKRGSSANTVLMRALGISLVHSILFCLE